MAPVAALRQRARRALALLQGDSQADRVVPPTGFTAKLTLFTAGAMAFLAVFALALSLATGRVASRWSEELARSATLRISAPADQREAQAARALEVLESTPGIASARMLSDDEQRALLAPWLGVDLPLENLPVPVLIEVIEGEGLDVAGLKARLAGEVPGAVYDDHARWRTPLVRAASRLRWLGLVALGLIAASMAAMITLAAGSALAANARLIATLRLVGARDSYIARAFVRRFTQRALVGAAVGTSVAMLALALLPKAETAGGFLTGLGFTGAGWLLPLLVPLLAAVTAFWATRAAALRTLRQVT
ncbi:cell division protein FtsX [Vannielia litorea]|uniref:cell division protein FtsX n=1 Tax=Vannielia litorea TaxID=1217970 RepID=UPI001FE54231|nr:FtsX-like permease family protein [Vannielia litorea]